MVERLFVLTWFAFEPFRKLPKVIDGLPVEVLDAPLDLALVLRARRKRKMSVDAKKLNNLLHARSIRRRLNSYNFDDGLDYNFTTGSKHQKRAQLLNNC
jgi:hypothetical protein